MFQPGASLGEITALLAELYRLAASSDYIRDMRINEKISALLTLLMSYSWNPGKRSASKKRLELTDVKSYLDEHYSEKITLDDLAARFYINKYYLAKIFKESYGVTVNAYLIARRITVTKQLLRFTDLNLEQISEAVGMQDANYLSRMFKKVEGIGPREYRKRW